MSGAALSTQRLMLSRPSLRLATSPSRSRWEDRRYRSLRALAGSLQRSRTRYHGFCWESRPAASAPTELPNGIEADRYSSSCRHRDRSTTTISACFTRSNGRWGLVSPIRRADPPKSNSALISAAAPEPRQLNKGFEARANHWLKLPDYRPRASAMARLIALSIREPRRRKGNTAKTSPNSCVSVRNIPSESTQRQISTIV